MPYRTTPFIKNNFYHIYNRGVEKRKIFIDEGDHLRFIQTLQYYQFSGPKPRFSTHHRFKIKDFSNNPKIVEIICYCLMPNHFHLLLKQVKEKGIQEFSSKVLNSYTKYFNTKNRRIGPLLQGQFKAVPVENDEQLLHLSRYIHLNPFVSELSKYRENFPFSSFAEFISSSNNSICVKEYILDFYKNPQDYRSFVKNHASYAKDLEKIKHLLIDDD